jgi:uncharacterized protein with PQ loop repeat
MLMFVIGACLAVVTVPVAWAQALTVLRRRTTDGLSPTYVLVLSWSAAVWSVHGYLHHNPVQAVVEALGLVASWVIVAALVREGRLRLGLAAISSALFGSMVGAVGAWQGRVALGAVAVALPLLCRIPQLTESWRNPGGHAISTGSFAAGAAAEALWIVNGALVGDPFTVAMSAYCGLHNGFVAVRSATSARRHAPPPPLVPHALNT